MVTVTRRIDSSLWDTLERLADEHKVSNVEASRFIAQILDVVETKQFVKTYEKSKPNGGYCKIRIVFRYDNTRFPEQYLGL